MQLIQQAGTALDTKVWGSRVGPIANELQAYTDGANVSMRDGWMVLEARKERTVTTDGQVRDYSSARVHSRGLWTVKPGYRLEVEAILPTTPGAFPAIWLTGLNMYTVGWPACGELDIAEAAGGWRPRTLLMNEHAVDTGPTGHHEMGWNNTTWKDLPEPLGAKLHRYGVQFDGNGIRWYLDGNCVRVRTRQQNLAVGATWPFAQPMELTLNLAVGSAGGDPALGTWPCQMLVGAIRIFAPGEPVVY